MNRFSPPRQHSGGRRIVLAGALTVTLGGLLASTRSIAQAAFDLQELRAQLQKHPVSRGVFVQEKHLRGLERPLASEGRYVLAQGQGLLWSLRTPFQQDYRITAAGIARRDGETWTAVSAQSAGAQQNRLLLALLNGDDQALAEQFDLQPAGSLADWQLRLLPRSLLLRQIFDEIRVSGGAAVSRVELIEAQGDRSVIRFSETTHDQNLTTAERSAFTS